MDVPQDVMELVPDKPVHLDLALFTQCVRNAPSGNASHPGGCTNEMLRICLDDHELFQLLFRAAGLCDGRHARTCEEGVHISHHDSLAEAGWRGAPQALHANLGMQLKRHVPLANSPSQRGRAQIVWVMQSGDSQVQTR